MLKELSVKEKEEILENLKEKISKKELFPCQIPLLDDKYLSCFGCCGRDFKSKKDILSDIEENTLEFKKIRFKSIFRLMNYRDRLSSNPDDLKKSGICSNLVKFSNCTACPLHPKINNLVKKEEYKLPSNLKNKDLRCSHCDVNYECTTYIYWKNFNDKEKQKFLKFVLENYNDEYKYSIDNIEGKLIFRFFKKE